MFWYNYNRIKWVLSILKPKKYIDKYTFALYNKANWGIEVYSINSNVQNILYKDIPLWWRQCSCCINHNHGTFGADYYYCIYNWGKIIIHNSTGALLRHITYRYDAWGRLYQQPVSRYLMLSKDADTTKPTSPQTKEPRKKHDFRGFLRYAV